VASGKREHDTNGGVCWASRESDKSKEGDQNFGLLFKADHGWVKGYVFVITNVVVFHM
jgi:hypothetical protein